MADIGDGEPGIQIFDTCEHLIEQCSTLVHDDLNVEDVDTKQEDHAYDTLRYLLTNVKSKSSAPPPPRQTRQDRTEGAKYL